MIIYFSGTGNSRYAAQMFANQLEDEVVDAGTFIKENRKAEICSEQPWIFVSPTYGWQIPHIFEEFIREGEFKGSKKAYFVMTCGSDIGNAGTRLASLCQEKGFEYQGVFPVVMPENYVAMFPVPNKEEVVKIMDVAQSVIESGIEVVRKGKAFSEEKARLVGKIQTSIVNPIFYKLFVKTKPFYSTDACTACGKCARACPLNNIQITDGKPKWSNNCTHCMACICGCPTEAIEYGKASRGKPRYWCEERG